MKKLLLVFLSVLCFLLSVQNVSATDGFTFSGTTTSIPETPITYNSITYTDYFYTFGKYGSSDNYLVLVYFNPTTSTNLTSMTDSAGDYISIPFDEQLFCQKFVDSQTNTGYVDFSTCLADATPSSSVMYYNSTDPVYANYFWSSSADVYNSTGDIIFTGTQSYSRPAASGSTYDPGQIPAGTAKFFPYYPVPTIQQSTGLPIMYFNPDSTSYKVTLSLAVNYTWTHKHLQLYQGTTKIDDFDFCANTPVGGICSPFVSTAGNITIALDSSDRIILSLPDQGDYTVRLLSEDNSSTAADYRFLVAETDPNLVIDNQVEINSYCDDFPHIMTGNMIGFAYDFDFHTDDICKMIIPPDNYLSNKFGTTYQNFLSKFGFIGQTSTLLSTAQTAFTTTPGAPTMPSITVMGHTWNTFDFSKAPAAFTFLRNMTAAAMWLLTSIVAFLELKSYFRGSGEEEII